MSPRVSLAAAATTTAPPAVSPAPVAKLSAPACEDRWPTWAPATPADPNDGSVAPAAVSPTSSSDVGSRAASASGGSTMVPTRTIRPSGRIRSLAGGKLVTYGVR